MRSIARTILRTMLRKKWHYVLCLAWVSAACSTQNPPAVDSSDDSDNVALATARALAAAEKLPGAAVYQQHCAVCHEGAVKKAPHRGMINLMTPESVLAVMTTGVMQQESQNLTDLERKQVAEYLGGRPLGSAVASLPSCDDSSVNTSASATLTNWGYAPTNTRDFPSRLTAEALDQLKVKWAIGFPGANRSRSQPLVAGDAVFVGSHPGAVYALSRETGCVRWQFQASGEVRTGFAHDREADALYFGDVLGNVYALRASSGTLSWRARADDHPNATITATPTLFEDTLYVPVSSLEVSLAVDPTYECCTFRGSVVAYAADSGDVRWKRYTIEQAAVPQSKNAKGTTMRGPSGAVIWNSPAIDENHRQLYVGTGENMSSPATLTSDAIFAIDLDSGEVNWVFQATANDVWNTACDSPSPESCPPEGGPDFDFGAATLLAAGKDGKPRVLAGQKSGMVHALEPATGELLWQTRVGRGGIQGGVHFGMAAANGAVFVPISDMADGRSYDTPSRPGVHALDIATGKPLWSSIYDDDCTERAFCDPGVSQAISVANNLVYAGNMAGMLRVHDAATGEIAYTYDTTQRFEDALGEPAFGGSFGGASGPVLQDQLLLLTSGYGIYNHMPGNLLLALEPDDK